MDGVGDIPLTVTTSSSRAPAVLKIDLKSFGILKSTLNWIKFEA